MTEEVYINKSPTDVENVDVEMEWIEGMKAWVPKITDEFIYLRNLNYGFVENKEEETEKVEEIPKEAPEWLNRLSKDFQDECARVQHNGNILSETEYAARWSKFYQDNSRRYEKEQKKIIKENKKRSAKPSELGWFEMDEDKNRFVYVENLPTDITIEEFVKEMGKVGMIMHDFHTHQPRARLYKRKDDDTKNKGDGIICYLKIESIDLALEILDGSRIRDNVIKVSRAKFEQKEGFDPHKRRRLTNKEKKKIKEKQENLFRWGLDTKLTRAKKDNTVIMKNVFDFEFMKDHPEMVFDIKEKLQKALSQVGKYRSVQVHELQPEGIVQINFYDPNDSDVAVSFFNNKLFNERKITAALWDGQTRYAKKETEEQEKERLEKWEKTLEGVDVAGSSSCKDDEAEGVDKGDETGSEGGDSD